MSFEISRFLGAFFLIFISGVDVYIEYLTLIINDITRNMNTTIVFKDEFAKYTGCRLVVQTLRELMNKEIGGLMFVGFWIAVLSNIGIVQGWGVVPWFIYFVFVVVYIITL